MVSGHFRWDFYGLSTDAKPTADNPRVADGSTFYEADTSKLYVWYNNQWYEKEAGGEQYVLPPATDSTLGGVKVGEGLEISEAGVLSATGGSGGGAIITLTADDYNYPEDNPTSVALWLMPSGLYQISTGVSVAVSSSYNLSSDEVAFVGNAGSFGLPIYTFFSSSSATNGQEYGTFHSLVGNGIDIGYFVLCKPYDALDSTSTNAPLTANQGKVLKDLIDALDARVSALEGN